MPGRTVLHLPAPPPLPACATSAPPLFLHWEVLGWKTLGVPMVPACDNGDTICGVGCSPPQLSQCTGCVSTWSAHVAPSSSSPTLGTPRVGNHMALSRLKSRYGSSIFPPLGFVIWYYNVLQGQWFPGSGSALIATLPPGPIRSPDSEPTAADGANKRGPQPSYDDQNLLYILFLRYLKYF